MEMAESVFIFLFLPISLLSCFLNSGIQKYVLILLSLFFYACGSPRYLILFLLITLFNITLVYIIQKIVSIKIHFVRTSLLILGIIVNIIPLFYYKYYDFAVGACNTFLHTSYGVKNLLLPLGISFFSFKSISLLIDTYTKKIILHHNPAYVALYLSFYGQIISGPIARYDEFYENYSYDYLKRAEFFHRFSHGGKLFVTGFVKKVLIANILGLITSEVFTSPFEQSSAALLWLGSISYSLQLFYDFSGYSDMAIGIGRMYGINCKSNFNYPYCCQSICEFWRRWHISLGNWFKDYIYFPMGGSRVKSKARLFFNLFVVWLLTGIWHGANWTFIFWGLAYFAVIALEKGLHLPGRLHSQGLKILYRVGGLMFINFQWIIFNSPSLEYGLNYIKHMFIQGNALANIRALVLLQEYGVIIAAAIIFSMPVVPVLTKQISKQNYILQTMYGAISAVIMTLLFILSISFVIAGKNNPFLYGNF